MAPRGALLLSSGVVSVLLRLVVCQLEAINARENHEIAHGEQDHNNFPSGNKSSDSVTWAPSTTGATATNVTPVPASHLGFGSECSRHGECDAFVGLTCVSHENGTTKCACPPSTPVYVTVGGVHKCVAASRQASNTHTTILIVILAITVLLLVVGYAYRKMRRGRDSSSSSSSSRSKRKRERHPSTSSSTTFILAEQISSPDIDSARELLAGDSEVFEGQAESRRHPRSPYLGRRLRDSSVPPRHGPRYIRQLDGNSFKQTSGLSTVQEGNEQVELSLCSTPGAENPDEDPTDKLLRPQKRRRLGSLARRKTGGDLGDSETNTSSYSPVHMLGPQDEQMQKVLDKQKVVVTIQMHQMHRRRSPGMAPSSPSEVSLPRRELAHSESTDEPFMKDLEGRLAHEARFSEDLSMPASTTRSVSAEPLLLPGAAAHSDAAKATTAKGSAGKVVEVSRRPHREAILPTTARVTFEGSVAALSTKEAQKGNARTVQPENELLNTIGLPTAADETLQSSQEESTTYLQLTAKSGRVIPIPDKSSVIADFYNAKARGPWSPRSFRSSIAVDRREANEPPRLVQYEKSSSAVTRPIHVPVEVTADGADFYIKGKQSHTQHEDNRMSDPADILPEKNSKQKRPTSTVLQDTENGANSARSRGSVAPSQNAALQGGFADDGKGGKKEKFHNDHIDIVKVGDLARLLSRLIRMPDKAEDASSDKDSALLNAQRPIKSKGDKGKQPLITRTTVNMDAVVTADSEENVAGIFPYFSGVISSGAGQKSVDRKPSSAVHTDAGKAGISQEPRASKQKPLMERFVSKATDRQAAELLEVVRAKRFDIKKRNTIAEADHSRNKQNVTAKITKAKPCDKITVPGHSSERTTASETSTNGEKYGSDHADGRILEAVQFIAPQGCPGSVPIEAASATQNISVGGESLLLTGNLGSTDETRDIFLNLSDIADMQNFLTNESSAFSTPSGTTPTLAPRKPSKEYTTKRLQSSAHTTERPFAKVLASLEGQSTKILNYNTKRGVQETETAPNESSSGGALLSSSQLSIDYETLEEATYERTSTVHSVTDSSMAFLIGGVPEMLSSTGSTARNPAAKVPAPSKAVKTTSVDSHRASKESLGVLLTFFDSSEGTVPPSESVSLSFMSSISTSSSNALYRVSDLADLPRLECSAAVVNRETGDGGAVPRIPVPRLASSSAVHTERTRQPAFSFTERGALTQLLPEPTVRSGRLPLTQRRDLGPHTATSRPWTEDVERVVMQGNKHYLGHHANRRPTAKLATSFDEAEYVRLKVHGQRQPESPATPVATEALTSMTRPVDPTRESCEPTLDLARRSTISSGSDFDMLGSDENNLEQLLKLSDLLLLQHSHVGLRDFNTTGFSWAPDSGGGAESKGETLEAQVQGEEALDLKTSPKSDANEQTSEKVYPANFSTTVDYERWLELEGGVSTTRTVDAAVTRATEPIVGVTPPLSSEHGVVLPNHSVARCSPGGLTGYGHPGQQGFGCGLIQSSATIKLCHGSPQVLLSTGMDEPTFESIYNAILQPEPEMVADPELNPPNAAASSPRTPSPTRTSSSDGSLITVLPIESPQEHFKGNETDTIETTGTGAPAQWCTSRLHSIRRRSLSDSSALKPMASPSVELAEARSDGARETTRLGGPNRLSSASVCSRGTDNNVAGVQDPTPVQPDTLTDRRETPMEITSPFFSFDGTVSSVSIKADASVDRPESLAANKQD